ncbi:YceD family protein [Gilvibacter sp.]|uniref:YceD family protein n=1 Tax=Gilvibacter sp. TaxID=2729997 RepID=UPI003B5238CF
MKDLKAYTIPFVGLKIGSHQFDYQIDNTFFEHFEYDEFHKADVKVDLELEKKSTLLDLHFQFNGTVNVNCDLTNEPYDQPISGNFDLVVKFGQEYNDEEEDLLILPHGSYEVDVAQYIYESIVLAVPAKRVHPGVADGTLKSEALDKLEELSLNNQAEQSDEDQTDPRWDDLKKLLTDK